MQSQITQFMAQGFLIANQSSHSVTMIKRKEFSILWLVIGLLLCVIPLFIYLIIYALETDQIVEIVMVGAPGQPYSAVESSPGGSGTLPMAAAGAVHMSPDGQAWWDGAQWQSTATSYPPHAARTPDGAAWWDGQTWRPMPGPGAAPNL
jgi:hypothetical protein